MKDEIRKIVGEIHKIIIDAQFKSDGKSFDRVAKILSQLQLSSMQRMADEVIGEDDYEHSGDGYGHFSKGVIKNELRASQRLKAQQLMEREK